MRSKSLHKLTVCALAAATVLSAARLLADKGGREDGDLILMQGKWKLIEFVEYRDGIAYRSNPEQARGTRTVTGNRYHLKLSVRATNVDDNYTFTLVAGQNPKAEDVVLPEPDGRVIRGIYEIDGNTLRRSYTQPGDPRPKTFQGGNQTYQVWRRVVELPEKSKS